MKKRAHKTRRQILAEKAAAAKKLVEQANKLKNPLESMIHLQNYSCSDENIAIECKRVEDLSNDELSWVFDLMERNMEPLYKKTPWGWDSTAKQKELTEPTARYLIAKNQEKLLGFSHFRFDIDYGVEVLYCYELQLEPSARRKGLGRFMMSALEAMASLTQMQKVVLTVFKNNPTAVQFFNALGYKLDSTSPAAPEKLHYVILSKQNLRDGGGTS